MHYDHFAHVVISNRPRHVHAYQLDERDTVIGHICLREDGAGNCTVPFQANGETFNHHPGYPVKRLNIPRSTHIQGGP